LCFWALVNTILNYDPSVCEDQDTTFGEARADYIKKFGLRGILFLAGDGMAKQYGIPKIRLIAHEGESCI
jgi:hypothetical protein